MADATNLLALPDLIHLVLIKTSSTGDTSLVASHHLQWRNVLTAAHGRISCSVEINGIGTEAKVPVGILEIKFEVIPRFSQVSSQCFMLKVAFAFINRIIQKQSDSPIFSLISLAGRHQVEVLAPIFFFSFFFLFFTSHLFSTCVLQDHFESALLKASQ